MRILLIILTTFILLSCVTSKKMYAGANRQDHELAHVYAGGLSRPQPEIYGKYQPSYDIEAVDGKNIVSPSRNNPGGRGEVLHLLPGRHSFEVRWWKLVSDDSYFMVTPGAIIPIAQGQYERSRNLYKFNIDLKAGHSYVVDMAKTLNKAQQEPEEMCLTEEVHDAKGHFTPPDKGYRVPSKNALTIQCVKP